MLGHDNPPSAGDFSRGVDHSAFFIEGRYYLSHDDLSAADLSGPHWLTVRKEPSGQRIYIISPQPPRRNTSARLALTEAIDAAFVNKKLTKIWADEDQAELIDEWRSAENELEDEREDLAEDVITQVAEAASQIADLSVQKAPATARRINDAVILFQEQESGLNPLEKAMRAVRESLPDIIVFDDDSRDLRSEYAIDELRSSVPEALQNLCDVAEISIPSWIEAYDSENTASITTMEYAANRKLSDRFQRDWKQSGISVSIRLQSETLAVQIVNERSEFTSFAERSDGLRQFAALIAFAGGAWRDRPIMLIDEAEQRLHYDAQADLVQMLARQKVSSKVIFTTHSAGCLPEDLGNGVKLIRPRKNNPTRSEVINKFWAENDPGLVPLLFGMGAGTLAFFPTRNAVVVEGPADMLLLPTIMKAALGVDILGYQFVPGLSVSGRPLHAPAIGETSGVLYLVDSDPGGNELKKKLISAGVAQNDIFQIAGNGALECEDLINPDLLLAAANKLMDRYHSGSKKLTKSDLPARLRTHSQKSTVAARAMAERKTFGHRS